jgi:hypothetical protein
MTQKTEEFTFRFIQPDGPRPLTFLTRNYFLRQFLPSLLSFFTFVAGGIPDEIPAGFVVDEMAEFFCQCFRFQPVSTTPPLLHTHSFTYNRRDTNLATVSVVKQHI